MTEQERWTDAEWAAEQVALARRQADAARAEARELRVALVEAENRVAELGHQLDESRGELKADRAMFLEENRRLEAQLAETRAALEAARAAVHTPSPVGTDPGTRTRALPVVPAAQGGAAMTAREMTPERLEWHRERVAKMAHAFGDHAGEDLLEHIDALQARVEAAERERDHAKTANGWDEWKRTTLEAFALIKAKRDAAEARARDAEAKLAALVEAVPAGTTVLCLAMVDACTSCERTFEESVDEDKCPSCGAEWCMTTYVGDPEYRVTHSELGDPKCLDAALRAARGEP